MDTTHDLLDKPESIAERHRAVRAALDALRYGWGDAYEIGCDDGEWWYRRRDGLAGKVTADSPDQMGSLIAEDHAFQPIRTETSGDRRHP
jgi:hypothetical protein